ncbi:MAG: hypothetical protein V2A79_16180 [Planctomycetota bacterium]
MSEPRILHELTVRFECPDVERADMRALRAAFAGMMDTAAQAIQNDRLDLDDCILEHWADVVVPNPQSTIRNPQSEVLDPPTPVNSGRAATVVRVEWLSEHRFFVEGLRHQCAVEAEAGPLALRALRLRVVREPRFDPFLRAPQSDSDAAG